jgi:hypothetical protein
MIAQRWPRPRRGAWGVMPRPGPATSPGRPSAPSRCARMAAEPLASLSKTLWESTNSQGGVRLHFKAGGKRRPFNHSGKARRRERGSPLADEDKRRRGRVPVTVSIGLGGLDQGLDLPGRQVLPGPKFGVGASGRRNCSIYFGWCDQLEPRLCQGKRTSRDRSGGNPAPP